MAQGVITRIGRQKLCKAHAGDITLPKIVKIALGKGGVNASGDVIETTGEETVLKGEIFRREIDTHTYPVDTTCRYSIRLGRDELADEFISEQGLYDEEGDLVAYKTFLPKGKDDDMEFVFHIDEIF